MTDLPPNLIRDALHATARRRYVPRPNDGMWHPSSISSRCLRRSLYTIRGVKETDERDARSMLVLEVGKELHRFVQTAVEEAYPDVEVYHEVVLFDDNADVPDSVPTTGSTDDLLIFAFNDGVMELQEYKTKNSNLMRSSKQLEALPEEDHIFQIKTYMRCLRRFGASLADGRALPAERFGNLIAGRITYVSKDDLKIAEYPVQYNPEVDDEMIADRVAELEAYRRDPNSLPPRLPLVTKTPKGKKAYTEKDWLCMTCPWHERCWNEDPDVVLPIIEEG